LLNRRDEHFGNGRLARTVFEHSVRRLAGRLAGVTSLTRALLTTLQPGDVVMNGVPPEVWGGLEKESHHFLLSCPGCGRKSRLPQRYLGSTVRCQHCQHEFESDWGEPEPANR
jgi:hypothetical protein